MCRWVSDSSVVHYSGHIMARPRSIRTDLANLLDAAPADQPRAHGDQPASGQREESRLARAIDLKYRGETEAARTLLYEVMIDGAPEEVAAARELLRELDSD